MEELTIDVDRAHELFDLLEGGDRTRPRRPFVVRCPLARYVRPERQKLKRTPTTAGHLGAFRFCVVPCSCS